MYYVYNNIMINGAIAKTGIRKPFIKINPIMNLNIDAGYGNPEFIDRHESFWFKSYDNGYYMFERSLEDKRIYLKEEVLNTKFICTYASATDEEFALGLRIKKGPVTLYKTKRQAFDMTDEYIRNIDAFLKQMFLYDKSITKCFMGKTLKVVKDLQTTLFQCNKLEMRECIASVNKYLRTTLQTMEKVSQKTDTSNKNEMQALMEQTKAQEFLEDMKYRNQVATEFLDS